MKSWETAIAQLRRRLAGYLILKNALTAITAWLFFWGTGILVLRVAFQASSLLLLWGLTAVPLLLAAAMVWALRQVPERAKVAAFLDSRSGCGGLLLAGEEQPLGSWEASLPEPAPVRIRWQAGRSGVAFAAGVVFVLFGLLLPERLTAGPARALEIGKETEKLAALVDLLKKESVLEKERAESLKEKLEQLAKEAKGADPVKTLEALDHVQDLVTKAAQEAAEAALGKTEKLAKAEALADGLKQAGKDLAAKVKAEAMSELSDLVKKAATETALLGKHLDAKTFEAALKGKLGPEGLKKLADALKGSKKDLADLMEKLKEARLIDPELLKKCECAGKCDGRGLAALLKKEGGKMAIGDMLKECMGKKAGKGGVTEGPGAADITFGPPSSEEGAKYKEQTLPPGALAELKKSMVIGLSPGDPKKDKGGKTQSGALLGSRAGGGSANTPVILPRHRGAVDRFFARPGQK
jgi:hypothetical protein